MISYVSLKYGPKHLGAVVAHSNDKTFLWYSKIGILSDMEVPPKLTLLYFGFNEEHILISMHVLQTVRLAHLANIQD